MDRGARQAAALAAAGLALLGGVVSSAAGWLDWSPVVRWVVSRAGLLIGTLSGMALLVAGALLWRRRSPVTQSRGALSWWLVASAALVVLAVTWGSTAWLLAEAGRAQDVAAARVEAIKTGLGIGAGASGICALMLAVRRQWHQEYTAMDTTLDATQRRVTELYTKAVEQLGSEKAPVRLGGLYALERLAQDNAGQRQTVVNVLCAYLRMPEPVFAADSPQEHRASLLAEEEQVRLTAQRILAMHLMPGAEERPDETFWPEVDLELSGARLAQFDLAGARLRSGSFTKARFEGDATFEKTEFSGEARFRGAEFEGEARFTEACFGARARFGRARFGAEARFLGTRFGGPAEFDGARFGASARFSNARFGAEAMFQRARFESVAAFSLVEFGGAASYPNATFGGRAEFSGARFRGEARFEDCRLRGVGMFDGTRFDGAAVFTRAVSSGVMRFGGARFADGAGIAEALERLAYLDETGGPASTFDLADVWIRSDGCAAAARLPGWKLAPEIVADSSGGWRRLVREPAPAAGDIEPAPRAPECERDR